MATPERRKRTLTVKRVTVPGNLVLACEQFNSGQYFDCHETLEELWQEEQGEVRDLYKGLIQIAAAFVHLTRGNHWGANRLLTTGLAYLRPYVEGGAMGFDVHRISAEAARAHERVRELGPERILDFDLALAPHYEVDLVRLPDEAVRWGAWGFDPTGIPQEMEITVAD